ncbi:hypothetical protein DFH11DRAFT_1307107 [Phellopilus nigrolimitatus]|nr:hypothetical protein DFH11DRAFT_1307107 [Phellopilus nigrolimitatus]
MAPGGVKWVGVHSASVVFLCLTTFLLSTQNANIPIVPVSSITCFCLNAIKFMCIVYWVAFIVCMSCKESTAISSIVLLQNRRNHKYIAHERRNENNTQVL